MSTAADSASPLQVSESARRTSRVIFVVLAALGLLLDQVTKALALEELADGPIPIWGDWFRLRLIFNPGAAFGTGTEFTIVFTIIAIVATGVVLYLSRRLASRFWSVGFGLLLAGIVGNLIDRIFRQPEPFHGHVIDFLSFGSFPVFNFADVFINAGAAVIIIQTFRGVRLDGTLERDHEAAAATDTPDAVQEDNR